MDSITKRSAHSLRIRLLPLLHIFSAAVFALFLIGCDGARSRPYGYIRMGPIVEMTADERLFPELRLLLRRDHIGYFVMSTLCPKDLYPVRQTEDGFDCPFCHSHYQSNGVRVSGESPADLPHYRLDLNRGDYDGAVNTLYAEVGREVSRSWRLQVAR